MCQREVTAHILPENQLDWLYA